MGQHLWTSHEIDADKDWPVYDVGLAISLVAPTSLRPLPPAPASPSPSNARHSRSRSRQRQCTQLSIELKSFSDEELLDELLDRAVHRRLLERGNH